MRNLLVMIFAALALAACQNEPIYNVNNHPMPTRASSFPLEKIESLIIEAGQGRGWIFERAGPGHLVATQKEPKFQAVVDVYFDQRSYRIAHKSTSGLKEKGDTVHPHYNFWIRNLDHDIEVKLANEALKSG